MNRRDVHWGCGFVTLLLLWEASRLALGNTDLKRTGAMSSEMSIWRKRQVCLQMIPEILVAERHNSRVGFVTICPKKSLHIGQWSITRHCHTEADV